MALAQSAGWHFAGHVDIVDLHPGVISVIFEGALAKEDQDLLQRAWDRVRPIMTSQLGFGLGQRVVVLHKGNTAAKTVQITPGTSVVFFPQDALQRDIQVLCHELAHSFHIYGRVLLDEGMACLIEQLCVAGSDENARQQISMDARLSGYQAQSPHSVALAVFNGVFLEKGWAGVRSLLETCAPMDDGALTQKFQALLAAQAPVKKPVNLNTSKVADESAPLAAYYLGHFAPMLDHLAETQTGTEEYLITAARLEIAAAYGFVDKNDLPVIPDKHHSPASAPLFGAARRLIRMKTCRSREDLSRLVSELHQDMAQMIGTKETFLDGKILEIQTLRFLPAFLGGSRKTALEKCSDLAANTDAQPIATHFEAQIRAELKGLGAP